MEEGPLKPSALILVSGLLAASAALPAAAFEARQGCFVADQACPAPTSIRGQGGGVAVEPGQSYRLLGANKAEATHLRIRVPSADPSDRWVAVGCGHTVASCEAAPGGDGQSPASASREYVLALSWQPAFCQGHQTKPECKAETESSFDATNLTLHGLWPQDGEYCGVSAADQRLDKASRWQDLPAVQLAPETRTTLEEVMPGTRSALERHEWLRHGTCFGAPPDTYFGDAVRLVREVDASPVRALFADHVGQQLTLDQIRGSFDAAFGQGAGQHVGVVCVGQGGARMITELRVYLAGEVKDDTRLADLLAKAPRAHENCPSGKVDPVGFER